MKEKLHVGSILQYSSLIESVVGRWKRDFGQQAVVWFEEILFGGKMRFGGVGYEGAQTKYLVAHLQTKAREYSDTPQWEIVDTVDREAIARANREYVEAHIHRWMTPIQGVSKIEGGCRLDPWSVDGDRMGLYALHNLHGQLCYMVRVESMGDLFELFDRAHRYASNFQREELVDMRYLTIAQHTSWLGKNGSHVHAIEGYFRKLDNEYVYFSLDTWCEGNHWLSQEHSPKPVHPTAAHVNCKKCLKKIEKLAGYIAELESAAEFLEGERRGSGWQVQARYQARADLLKQVVTVLRGETPTPLRTIAEYVAEEALKRHVPVPETGDPAESVALDPADRRYVGTALRAVFEWMQAEPQGWNDRDAVQGWCDQTRKLKPVVAAFSYSRHL